MRVEVGEERGFSGVEWVGRVVRGEGRVGSKLGEWGDVYCGKMKLGGGWYGVLGGGEGLEGGDGSCM